MIRTRLALLAGTLMVIALVACNADQRVATSDRQGSIAATPYPRAADVRESPTSTPEPSPAVNRWVTPRPEWLGTRVLEEGPQGFAFAQRTPPILRNRRLPTVDLLKPPTSDRFKAQIGRVPMSVVKRSTWRPKCPVSLNELSYVTMTFWGFDHKSHTGEMIVNAAVAKQIVGIFKILYRARFPIEEMRVVSLEEQREQRKRPTGDGNITSSFECRIATLGSTWSQHAYGLAIDINPFHNPYARGDLVVPELATAYVNRGWRRPGMIVEGGVVTRAFDAIGWGWGGRWSSLKDWMHFSQNGT